MPEPELPEYNMNINGEKSRPVYLYREKESQPSFNQPKHPHGNSPPTQTHPQTGAGRQQTYGNDNSSVNRQSRVQSNKPDPIPGAPYAGASAQRMGSASLKRPPTIRGSGAIANKAYDGTESSRPPSSFQSPHARFDAGLDQVMSQHNLDHQPPMPKPPLFSAW